MNKVIHTKTQEEFNKVMQVFEDKKWRWYSLNSPMYNLKRWDTYGDQTCIQYIDRFTYSPLEYFSNKKYIIISFEQFLKEEGIEIIKEKNNLPKELNINGNIYILKE